MRFFQRAVEVYEQGLQTSPKSLDLAYNKARVQLEICTHPTLVGQLKQPLLEVLQIALTSHRHALQLSPDNIDTLFNTSQVLRSIAEEVAGADDLPSAEAVKLLEEAWELQSRCFEIQKVRYLESQEEERIANEQAAAEAAQDAVPAPEAQADTTGGSGGGDSREAGEDGEEEEQWVSVVEPVTKDTLLDTVVAQLETLTTLCTILTDAPDSAPPSALSFAEKHSTGLIQILPELTHDKADRLQEVALAKANFVSSLLSAGTRAGKLEPATYKKELDAAFAAPELLALPSSSAAEGPLAHAKALITFSSVYRDNFAYDPAATAPARWGALTQASERLAAASKTAGIEQADLAATHLLRGDCSMYLHNLQYAPALHGPASDRAPQLLKNAEIFYRNAQKLGADAEDKAVAGLRSSVAGLLLEQGQAYSVDKVLSGCPLGQQWAIEQLEDMMAEGLLPPHPQMG
ncbi:protein O-mannosyl-transferase [Microdochium nivale]|nr:protein O-mannosyl-transferase [Microdochium nivale]